MLGQRLKALRAARQISQKDLAAQLFVSPQAVGKWEREEATPNPETVRKLSELFDVSADYLLGRDGEASLRRIAGRLFKPPIYESPDRQGAI